MSILGVIPAAGKGERWGGYYKELLPCGDGEWLLDRTVSAMQRGGADAVLVVTRIEKLAALAEHLRAAPIPVFYTLTTQDDMYGAFEASFAHPAGRYLFAMPDTYYPLDAFQKAGSGVFSLGTHETEQPERFGVLMNNHVVNKQRLSPGPHRAWGLLTWTPSAVRHWQRAQPRDYTEAINTAIAAFGLDTWSIAYYHDMASFADYRGWLT